MDFLATCSLAIGAALIASAVSGMAGFGGALLLLPALTGLYGIERALPLLALAQLVGNTSRAVLGFREIDWRVVGFFVAGAVPATIGATMALLSFSLPSARLIVSIVVVVVAFWEAARVFTLLPQRWEFSLHHEGSKVHLTGAGVFIGVISSIAGSAGPLPNAIFLRLQLNPTAYVASDAAAMGIVHAAKLVVFGTHQTWHLPDLITTTAVATTMVAGTWLGLRVLGRVQHVRYRRIVAIWLCLAALAMFFFPVGHD